MSAALPFAPLADARIHSMKLVAPNTLYYLSARRISRARLSHATHGAGGIKACFRNGNALVFTPASQHIRNNKLLAHIRGKMQSNTQIPSRNALPNDPICPHAPAAPNNSCGAWLLRGLSSPQRGSFR